MGALAWISSTMTLGTLPSTTLQKLIHSAWAGPCYVPLIVSIILSQLNVEQTTQVFLEQQGHRKSHHKIKKGANKGHRGNNVEIV